MRLAWVFDPEASPEQRIMHGAVLLLVSADERLRGADGLPSGHFNEGLRQALIKNCTEERDSVRALIERAGVRLHKKGKGIDRLELDSPEVVVKVRLNVTELMGDLLHESPGWYNLGSSVIHSLYWGLRDASGSFPGAPLALTPPLLEVGAAVESAISASGLILTRCAGYYGHDPSAYVQRTKGRREAVDLRMRRFGAAQLARLQNPFPPRPSS